MKNKIKIIVGSNADMMERRINTFLCDRNFHENYKVVDIKLSSEPDSYTATIHYKEYSIYNVSSRMAFEKLLESIHRLPEDSKYVRMLQDIGAKIGVVR